MNGKGSRKNNPDWEKVSKEQTGNTRDSWRKKTRPAAAKSTKNSGKAQDDFQQNQQDDRLELVDKKLADVVSGMTFTEGLQEDEVGNIATSLNMTVDGFQDGQAVLRYKNDYSGSYGGGYYLLSLDENNTPRLKVSTGGNSSMWKSPDTFIQDTTWEDLNNLKLESRMVLKAKQYIGENNDFYMDSMYDIADMIAEDSGMEIKYSSGTLVDYVNNVVLFDPETRKYYQMNGVDYDGDMKIYNCYEVEPREIQVGDFTAHNREDASFDSPKVNEFLVAMRHYYISEGGTDSSMDLYNDDIISLSKKLGLDYISVEADDSEDFTYNPEGTGIITTSSDNKQNGRYAKEGYLIGDKESGEYIAVQTEYASEDSYNDTPEVTVDMVDGKPVLSSSDMWKVTRTGFLPRTVWDAVDQDQ